MFINPRGSLKLGSPDRILGFTRNQQLSRSMLIIEAKTPWALPTDPELDLPRYYNQHSGDSERDPVIKALHQIYGYMTLNSLKYGILTNGDTTFVFRRVFKKQGVVDTGHGGVLECSPTISVLGRGLESPVAAYAFVAALSYQDEWFHHSLADDFDAPPTEFELDQVEDILAPLPTKTLFTTTKGFKFQIGRALSAGVASTMIGQIVYRKAFLCDCIIKTYDLANKEAEAMFEHECGIYDALSHLQGHKIPRLYIKGKLMGLIGMLTLEDCGETLQEGVNKAEAKKALLKALELIHAKGILHNDIAPRNVVFKVGEPPESAFRLIDFGLATFNATERERQEELLMVDALDSSCFSRLASVL
ncbi:hypothetical protein ABW21_db0200947 [Orbilia brochopaga]|nr:hypothetical protein ABW21_db0200947 [Drechslerella brochopaga]